MINPHGQSRLVNQVAGNQLKKKAISNQSHYKQIVLDKEQIKDVKNIAYGVYSPLTGFLKQADLESVLQNMRLTDQTLWPVPIVLDISQDKYQEIKGEKTVMLVDSFGIAIALMQVEEIYSFDKHQMATSVYQTDEHAHPGVAHVYSMEDFLVGGEITLLDERRNLFPEHNYLPSETREIFDKRGWHDIVAFQTRNVPHRGHEFLQHEALKKVDGLFIQPVIGEKKIDDFKDEYIISSYEILVDKYFPQDQVLLGILPLRMRYAGPREAVFHAIIRKNFGCNHFIVGRDHAGVGSYYSPFAAQEIFETFEPQDLGVKIVKFEEVVYNTKLQKHVYAKDCPQEDQLHFSGTKIRAMIQSNTPPPKYLVRPEIFNLLTSSTNTMVDTMYKKAIGNKKGFVLWFTGLSGAGKSTVANHVFENLKDRGLKLERLDGDVVRETLTKDLGFSKEDRHENIKRVGFVAKLLSRNGVGVISSFISPYKVERQGLRDTVENFIEVFVDTPLEVCEDRDVKGLYQKARSGQIKNFTGISDPYEEPENPEITLYTHKYTLEESTNQVIDYLVKQGFIDELEPSFDSRKAQ